MNLSGSTDRHDAVQSSLSESAVERLSGLLAGLDRLEAILTLPRYPAAASAAYDLLHFRVTSRLGAGRFGIVLLADDLGLGRQVVVKVPQPAMLTDPSLRERFVREARAAARLDHPGIVSVFEAGEFMGLPYLAAAWINGPTLKAWRKQYPGAVSAIAAASFARSVAEAIHHAHERGVLHCDLTPANILLQPVADGQAQLSSYLPLVTDFGLARLLDDDPSATRTFQVAGTPLYMAPEQARGDRRNLTARSDVYALGAILYELLVGCPPFQGETTAVLSQLQSQSPEPPRRRVASIPRDLNAICLKCLEKQPADRYPSANALVEDLDRFLNGRPVNARSVGLPVRLARLVARHPLTAGIAISATCVTAIAIGVAADRWAKEVQARADLKVEHAENVAASATIQATLERAKAAEFYATLERVTQRRLARSPGWSRANEVDLMRLCQEHPQAANAAVRSEIAAISAAIELSEPRRIAVGFHGHDVAYDPSGRWLAVAGHTRNASGMGVVQLYEASTGVLSRVLEVPADAAWERRTADRRDGCWTLRFDLTGSQLVAGTRSGWVVLWDLNQPGSAPSARWRHAPPGTEEDSGKAERIARLVFDQSGRLWSGDDRTSAAWGLREPGVELERHPGILARPAADLPAAPALVLPFLAAQHTSQQWFIQRQESYHLLLCLADHLPVGRLALLNDDRAEDNTITDMLVSPNGAILATSATHANHLKLWDLVNGQLLCNRLMPPGSLRLSFRPDGRELAVVEDDSVQIFQIPQPTVCDTVATGPCPLDDAALSKDESKVAMLSTVPDRSGLMYVDVHDLKLAQPSLPVLQASLAAPFYNSRRRLGISPSGDQVVWHAEERFERLSENGTQRVQFGEPRGTRDIQFTATGQLWTIGEQSVTTWIGDRECSLPAGGSVASLLAGDDHTLVGLTDGNLARFSSDGKPLGSIAISDAGVTALVRDDDRVIAGTADGDVYILALNGAIQRLAQGHADVIWAVAAGPNGQFATGSADQTVRIWNRKAELVVTLTQTRPVRRLFWTSDGRTLLVLAEGERAMRRWQLDALHSEFTRYGIPPAY